MPSTARTQRRDAVDRRHGGWTKLDGDGPAIREAFDGYAHVAAVSFLQFINAILYLPALPGNQTGNCWPQARLHPIQQDQRDRGD